MNIHWHIGNVEKSVWFDQMIQNKKTIGIIWNFEPIYALSDSNIYYISASDYSAFDIAKFVRSRIKAYKIDSIVIYTNFHYKETELEHLYNYLMDIDEYCRVVIMCKE